MKRKLLFILCAITALLLAGVSASADDVAINTTNFPNNVFRDYVSENFDTNGDDSLSADEIANVWRIDVFDKGIYSLQGIEFFTELTHLTCANNHLTSLYLDKNTKLTVLTCGYNDGLTSLYLCNNKNFNI